MVHGQWATNRAANKTWHARQWLRRCRPRLALAAVRVASHAGGLARSRAEQLTARRDYLLQQLQTQLRVDRIERRPTVVAPQPLTLVTGTHEAQVLGEGGGEANQQP